MELSRTKDVTVIARFLMVVAAGIVGMTALASAQTAPAAGAIGSAPRAKATIAQVGFIAGPWGGMLGDRKIEQHWMTPAATSMVGMYRSIQNDKATLYELLAIEQEGDGLMLRIKHFVPGAGLAGREEKSVDHALVRVEGRTAVFEGIGENPTRVTFTSPDPGSLTITVERMRDGKLVPTDFKYTRVKGS